MLQFWRHLLWFSWTKNSAICYISFKKSSKCYISVKKNTHILQKRDFTENCKAWAGYFVDLMPFMLLAYIYLPHKRSWGDRYFLQNWTMICPKIFVQMQFVKETVESWQVADIVQKLSTFCFLYLRLSWYLTFEIIPVKYWIC